MFTKFILAFMAFFAIMNPISNLPAYMAIVADDDQNISRKIARKSILVAFAIIFVFVWSGHLIFQLFGITLDALKIAGGILVALIGYHMINGVHSPSSNNMPNDKEDPTDVAISPLAMPLFAGPGTIATAISLSEGKVTSQVITLLAFASLCLITYCLLISAKKVSKLLGKSMMSIITRMMGLILTTIGIQMLIEGIKGALL
ncbi:MarC family protein [Streptococcus sp. zg-JUN1979]|uniref:MarC family protein n=1 Tax=Streptococcus sp. zg-JUN1979 TaxID=3391450 RepID=UPI0039A597B5